MGAAPSLLGANFPIFRIKRWAINKGLKYKKKCFCNIALYIMVQIICWCYAIFGEVFKKFPRDYEWIFGLLIPPFLETFYSWTLEKITFKASENKKLRNARIAYTHFVKTRHAILLTTIIGSSSTPATDYCIIGVCFFLNLATSIRIIHLVKKKGLSKDNKIGMWDYY